MTKLPAALLFVLFASTPAFGHDFWVEPTTFVTSPGQVVGLTLRVGQDLLGDRVPRDPSAIDQFVLIDREVKRQVPGRDGADPAGIARIESTGLVVVGYRSRPSQVTLPGEKFTQYLREEGLDAVVAARSRRNQTVSDGRELFSRAAKCLLLSGSPSRSDRDRALGFRLELVADENPYALAVGQELPVRLLFESQPLAGALVVAINKKDPTLKQLVRSDAHGRVRFRLGGAGMWMIKAVHMVPADEGAPADWESVWASLTFELPVQAGGRSR